jgi:N-acylneuraminate cytidylyltransferase
LNKNHKYVFPAIPINQQHQRSFTIKSLGAISILSEDNIDQRTQDLPVLFTDAGQFYLGYAETWRAQQPILSSHSGAISMKLWEVIDVDTPEDWEVVLSLYHSRSGIKGKLLTESKAND